MSVATHMAMRIPAARGILAAFIPGGGPRSFPDGHRRAGITGQGTGDAERQYKATAESNDKSVG
jgi:hypothetical protein